MSQSALSRIERGEGAHLPIAAWIGLADVLGLVARFELGRDPIAGPVDAGHLAIQELLLRLARSSGYDTRVELPIRAGDAAPSIEVVWRRLRDRVLIILEAWNTIRDLGAASRSFDRKVEIGRDLGATMPGGPYVVSGVWVVRDTKANRELVACYPEFFAARFPGSSRAWLRALTLGDPPPGAPGLVWCDSAATRLFARRRPGPA